MVSVWLGPWDSNPALPAYQADCLTNWHRPQYLVGNQRIELCLGEPQSPVLPLHQKPHIFHIFHLQIYYIINFLFFQIKSFGFIGTLYGQNYRCPVASPIEYVALP